MSDATIHRLVDAQTQAQKRISAQAIATVKAEIARMRPQDWYDPEAVAVLARAVGMRSQAASATSAMLMDGYLARVIAEMTGQRQLPAGVIDLAQPLRLGVDEYAAVYERLAQTYRYQASIGKSHEASLSAALGRSTAQVLMDLALARREQARQTLLRSGSVTGFRRIIRPYLSESGTCGLCMVAADRRYSIEDLMPIHDRCQCTILPATTRLDPGLSLNQRDLDEIYEAAGTTYADGLKNVRVRVDMHGELGPVLVDARHRTKTAALRHAA